MILTCTHPDHEGVTVDSPGGALALLADWGVDGSWTQWFSIPNPPKPPRHEERLRGR